jgi:hypothetical protein
MFKQMLRRDKLLRKRARHVLALNRKVDAWNALKDGFYQRSFMLRELVGWVISHRSDLSMERGHVRDRADLIRERVGAARRSRRNAKA